MVQDGSVFLYELWTFSFHKGLDILPEKSVYVEQRSETTALLFARVKVCYLFIFLVVRLNSEVNTVLVKGEKFPDTLNDFKICYMLLKGQWWVEQRSETTALLLYECMLTSGLEPCTPLRQSKS